MRLIDADALDRKIVEMTREPAYQHTGEDWLNGLCMAMEAVNEAPTVEAVVLPCKVGDTVFVLWRLVDPDICSKCPDFCWGGMGDSNECGKTEDGWRSPECIDIQEWTATLDNILGWIRYDEFNKTVFQTREEAEAALAEMKGGAENA